ncbi:MAG: RsiV family protein [Ignavibacteria bacterium]|nr:RsiV family protein [Ignavibacteria bacterium]
MKYTFLLLFLYSINVSAQKSWYKCFEGNVGSSSAEMHIVKYEEKIYGYFWFTDEMEPYVIFGSTGKDSLTLYSYKSSSEISFNGYLNKGKFTGTSGISVSNFRESDTNPNRKEMSFNLSENTGKSGMFEFVYVYGLQKVFKDWEGSPSATYTEGSVWPVKSNPYFSQIASFILKEKNFPSGLTEIGKVMLENKKKFFENYKSDTKGLTKKEASEYPAGYMRDETDISAITYINSKFLVLGRYSYGFSGGAHGNYATQYRVFELTSGKLIKLNDILAKEGISKLPDLLERYFRVNYLVKPTESLMDFGLFENSIKPNENFILTPGCLVFVYAPYEIGPYALGEISIYIPLKEVKDYLKPEIKELLN